MAKQYKDYLTKEQKEHKRLVEWLNWAAKDLLWNHTPSEGKRTPYERFVFSVLGSKKGVPDFLFFEKRGKYCGLAIELKAEGERVYKKSGECYFPDQEKWLKDLEERGWKTSFQVGYDNAKEEIEKYLEL